MIVNFSHIAIVILDFSLSLLVKLSLLIFFAKFLVLVLFYSYRYSNYCDSYNSSLLWKQKDLCYLSLSPSRGRKSDNYYCGCKSWKSDNYMESNTEKKSTPTSFSPIVYLPLLINTSINKLNPNLFERA